MMSKFIAGKSYDLKINGKPLTVKIEDASKSESIQVRVEQSSLPEYKKDGIYEVDRSALDI